MITRAESYAAAIETAMNVQYLESGEPLIQLFVDSVNSHGVLSKATTKLSWCIEPELRDMLDCENIINPHLVISVWNEDTGETSRQLVPLQQAITYVSFNHCGKNNISAILLHGHNIRLLKSQWKLENKYSQLFERVDETVVYSWTNQDYDAERHAAYSAAVHQYGRNSNPAIESRCDTDKMKRSSILHDLGYMPKLDLFGNFGDDAYRADDGTTNKKRQAEDIEQRDHKMRNMKNLFTTETVYVDDELFAVKPNKHLMFFIDLWHENKLKDQCHLRQRLMLLVFVKVWPILLWSIFRTVCGIGVGLICWGVGFRAVNWKAAIKPWSTPFGWLQADCTSDNNYLADNDGNPKWWLFPAAPIGWLMLGIPAAVMHNHSTINEITYLQSYIEVVQLVVAAISLIMIIVGMVFFCAWAIIAINSEVSSWSRGNISINIRQYVNSKLDKNNTPINIDYAPLTCPIDGDDHHQPSNHTFWQRVKLTVMRTKAKVCKPFPG